MIDTLDYVSLEIAKLLKDKNFNEYCEKKISKNTGFIEDCDFDHVKYNNSNFDSDSEFLSCPTLYETVLWIYKKYGTLISVFFNDPVIAPHEFLYCILDSRTEIDSAYGSVISNKSYESIQEALSEGIKHFLKKFI